MRLAVLLLTGVLALAQAPAQLPWQAAPALPWQLGEAGPAPAPFPSPPPQAQDDLTVRLAADGALRITDAKGLIRLRMGLPGRPLRAWRDWGLPVADPLAPIRFSASSPLQRGIGGLPVGAGDFRSALEGLLWILEDDEAFLTVIHPATAQVVYLPLPGGQNLNLSFHPDRLEAREGPAAAGGLPSPSAWSLHWLALLPQFIQLGKAGGLSRNQGTALAPFPRD